VRVTGSLSLFFRLGKRNLKTKKTISKRTTAPIAKGKKRGKDFLGVGGAGDETEVSVRISVRDDSGTGEGSATGRGGRGD